MGEESQPTWEKGPDWLLFLDHLLKPSTKATALKVPEETDHLGKRETLPYLL